ncbi:leucine rich repeat family protein [Anaeramoeba flamelloides]|uniref:Leucine rich repeat family protein n=1 Tax=Anaeramoeba flamelloides TaxID=1746091 RepID=A0ABQ8XKE7_9EUKA|nr:leucine rich repeat family protein [Anaeramoeba flamelloides]
MSFSFGYLLGLLENNDPSIKILIFLKSNFQENELEKLFLALKENTYVNKLLIREHNFRISEINSLGRLFSASRSLKCLHLERVKLKEKELEIFCKGLAENKSLQILGLRNLRIGANITQKILPALNYSNSLTELDFSWNSEFNSNCGICLSQLLSNENCKLKKLDLSFCYLGVKGIKSISVALKTNTTLKYLNLTSNPIKSEGFFVLSKALTINKTLENLKLSNCQIKTPKNYNNFPFLNDYFYNHKEGGFSKNNINKKSKEDEEEEEENENENKDEIGLRAIKAFSLMLVKNKTLKNIRLSDNSLRDTGAKCLANSLLFNNNLIKLDISNCKITGYGIKEMFNCLQQNENSSLQILILEYNILGTIGAKAISNYFDHFINSKSKMCVLKIGYTYLNLKGLQIIIESFKKNNNNLSHLSFHSMKLESNHPKNCVYNSTKSNQNLEKNIMNSNTNTNTNTNIINHANQNNNKQNNNSNNNNNSSNSDNNTIINNSNSNSNSDIKNNNEHKKNDFGKNKKNISDNMSDPNVIFIELIKSLQNQKSLNTIKIGYNKLSPHLNKILKPLQQMKFLRSISLDHCKIGVKQLPELCKFLEQNTFFKKIRLANNPLTDECAQPLVDAIRKNKVLKDLNLSLTSFTDCGLKIISQIFKGKSNLSKFKFQNIDVGKIGFKTLFEILKRNNILKILRIREVNMDEHVLRYICDCLLVNKTLSKISFTTSNRLIPNTLIPTIKLLLDRNLKFSQSTLRQDLLKICESNCNPNSNNNYVQQIPKFYDVFIRQRCQTSPKNVRQIINQFEKKLQMHIWEWIFTGLFFVPFKEMERAMYQFNINIHEKSLEEDLLILSKEQKSKDITLILQPNKKKNKYKYNSGYCKLNSELDSDTSSDLNSDSELNLDSELEENECGREIKKEKEKGKEKENEKEHEKEKENEKKRNVKKIIPFPVHKFILHARSKTFNLLFTYLNQSTLKDYSGISSKIMKILINYLYTDKIELPHDNNRNKIIEQLINSVEYFQLNPKSKLAKLMK